jgi:lipopolysaccharide-binding protein
LARFVYAFDDEIRGAIESAISTAIISGAGKLDTFLLELPRILPIDDTSAIDVTVVDDPFVGPTFLSVAAKGEFVSLKQPTLPPQPDHSLSPGIFCKDSAKMVTIALCDYVINSAAEVYYEAGALDWFVDKLPQQSLLNTAFWKWVIPQLYKKYPNEDMALDFSVSGAPQVDFTKDGANALAAADLTILVKTDNGSVPVACLSMVGVPVILLVP